MAADRDSKPDQDRRERVRQGYILAHEAGGHRQYGVIEECPLCVAPMPEGVFDRDPCDGCDGTCGDVCPVMEAQRLARNPWSQTTALVPAAERDRLRAENERLRRENATMRWQMSAADVPCGCKQTCGDDGDIDGPGTCKDLPMKREPLVELITVRRSPLTPDEQRASVSHPASHFDAPKET